MVITGKHAVAGVLQFRPKLIQKAWIKKELQNEYTFPVSVRVETQVPKAYLTFGVAAEISDTWIQDSKTWDFKKHPEILYICLDHLEDPQNMGAIARASALLGAKALVFPKDRQVGITPAVVSASSGLIFGLDVIQTSNMGAFLKTFKQKTEGWVYGMHLTKDARPVSELSASKPCCLVVGNEERGLSKPVSAMCDVLYQIPMALESHSLNVSQATTIGLYQMSLRSK
jgi:tRNA G18 (ribose-2'-O)-methylase SpoU